MKKFNEFLKKEYFTNVKPEHKWNQGHYSLIHNLFDKYDLNKSSIIKLLDFCKEQKNMSKEFIVFVIKNKEKFY